MRSETLPRLSDAESIDTTLPPDTRYLGLEHIERGGRILGHDTVAGARLASTKFWFSPDHVLFGKLRPNLGKVSRPDFDGVCSTDISPIRPGAQLDRGYLAQYLAQPSMVDFAASRAAGANLPRLSPSVLAKFPLPLPPLRDQRRIAAILDQADALRTKRHQVLARLDDLTRSIFHDMFESRVWPTAELSETVRAGTSVTYGIVQAGQEFRGGVPYIRTGDIVDGRIRAAGLRRTDPTIAARFERSTVRSGDIVMSIRETVGTTAVVSREMDGANLTREQLGSRQVIRRLVPTYLAIFGLNQRNGGYRRR